MSFFNPLKDILDVKLTTYGVESFANGTFRPEIFIASDVGMLYEDYELDEDFREYLRTSLAFLRPQREDTGFDTGIQNFDYFFDSISPYAIGSALETVIGGEKRTMVPNLNLSFGKGLVSSATKSNNSVSIVLDNIETTFKQTEIVNESNNDDNIFGRGDNFYRFAEDYMFVDVGETGSEYLKENFWLLVYEKYGEEYRQIDLEEQYLSEFGLVEGKKDVVNELIIKLDNKIDDVYICRHAQKINDNNNVYITNKGTVNIDLMGKMCKNTGLQNFSKVYVNRKEKDLGDQC